MTTIKCQILHFLKQGVHSQIRMKDSVCHAFQCISFIVFIFVFLISILTVQIQLGAIIVLIVMICLCLQFLVQTIT